MRTLTIALALMLAACGGAEDDYPEADTPDAPEEDAAVAEDARPDACAAAHEHMDRGGFWCGVAIDVPIEPTFTREGCRWCYLVTCHADREPTYILVECAGLE